MYLNKFVFFLVFIFFFQIELVTVESLYLKNWNHLPKFMHFFDENNLKEVFESCGFIVEKSYLFPRPYFPLEVQLDGRESVGIIAKKI